MGLREQLRHHLFGVDRRRLGLQHEHAHQIGQVAGDRGAQEDIRLRRTAARLPLGHPRVEQSDLVLGLRIGWMRAWT